MNVEALYWKAYRTDARPWDGNGDVSAWRAICGLSEVEVEYGPDGWARIIAKVREASVGHPCTIGTANRGHAWMSAGPFV